MEQKPNEKTIKKALWLLVGIPVIVVLVMFGILIYNNYLHEKKLTETKTGEKEEKLTEEMVEEKVLEHLENKYRKKFKCVASEGPSLLKDYYTFILSEINNSTTYNEFKAFYYPEKEESYEDGYYGLIMRELLKNEIVLSNNLDNYNYKMYFKFRKTTFSNKLTINSSLEDAVAEEGEIDSVLYLFGTKDTDINSLISELKKLKITGTLYFYIVDTDTFLNISCETYEEIISGIISKKINVISEKKIYIE